MCNIRNDKQHNEVSYDGTHFTYSKRLSYNITLILYFSTVFFFRLTLNYTFVFKLGSTMSYFKILSSSKQSIEFYSEQKGKTLDDVIKQPAADLLFVILQSVLSVSIICSFPYAIFSSVPLYEYEYLYPDKKEYRWLKLRSLSELMVPIFFYITSKYTLDLAYSNLSKLLTPRCKTWICYSKFYSYFITGKPYNVAKWQVLLNRV